MRSQKKQKKCRFCMSKLDGIDCPRCGCISPFRRNLSINSNSKFTDYSYNRYESSIKNRIYYTWVKFVSYLFITNSWLGKIFNIVFSPLTGGRPDINFSKNETFLDVGCGKGAFIEVLPVKWKKFGCDIVNYKSGNKNILIGNFENMKFDRKFSVVRSSHSLEHSKNPKKFLDKMTEVTKKDGILVILSPNANSFSYMLFRNKWFTLNVESHYCILNIKSIEEYLKRKGFKIIYKKTYTLLSSAGSLGNLLGKSNSLFFLLIFSVLFLPLTFMEILLGKADSFIIYAKKL